MKKRPHTFEWRDDEVVEATYVQVDEKTGERTVIKPKKQTPKVDIQDMLLLFTVSTVTMVFAGGALIAFFVFVAAIIFS